MYWWYCHGDGCHATGSCAASACSLVLQVAVTTMGLSRQEGDGTVEGKSPAESRSTPHHGRAGSRSAHEGRDRRRRDHTQQSHTGGVADDKRKVSPPSKGSGEGKLSSDGGSGGKGGGSMPVSKNVSYAEVLKTRSSTESVPLSSKVSSRCQTPSDASSPSLSRRAPPPLAGGISTPDTDSIADVCSPSMVSESSKKGRPGMSSPGRLFVHQDPAKTRESVATDEESSRTPDSERNTDESRQDHKEPAEVLVAGVMKEDKDFQSNKGLQQEQQQHPSSIQPRIPVGQLPSSPLTPESQSSSIMGHRTVSPGQPSTPVGQSSTVHKQSSTSPGQSSTSLPTSHEQSSRLHGQPSTATSQSSGPLKQPASVRDQQPAPLLQSQPKGMQSLQTGGSQVGGGGGVAITSEGVATGSTLVSQEKQQPEKPSNLSTASESPAVPVVTKASPQSRSDGILASAPDKTPPVLPPGLSPPLYPHMIAVTPHPAPHPKQYSLPPQTHSGLIQQPSLLPPSLSTSRHPPHSLAQPMLELDKVAAALAQQQQHLHSHSLQGPPMPYTPQTAFHNSTHPRPLLPGQPTFTAQQYDTIVSLLQQHQQHQQQQVLRKILQQQQLEKMEQHQHSHSLFLDLTKTAQLQQRPQQLYQPPLPSVSGKVEVAPPRATMQPYLMHTPPQHPVSHMAWSRASPGPMYRPSVPASYPHMAIPQRPPLMMPMELPSSTGNTPTLASSASDPSVEGYRSQTSPDVSQASQPALTEGDVEDREQNSDSLKSSSLSIKATPFVPKVQPPALPTGTTSSAAGPRLDHTTQVRKTGFQPPPQELSVAFSGRSLSQGLEQASQPTYPHPLSVPQASLLYNSVQRMPHSGVSTMMMMPQMMKQGTVATAGRKGRESYTVLPTPPDRGSLLQNAPLHRQLSGGNATGSLGEKGGKEQMPMYRYPPSRPGMGTGEVLGSAAGMDLAGRHHIHPPQNTVKVYQVSGHPAGALHSGKAIIPPPNNDPMLQGAGRSSVMSGGHPQRDVVMKSLHGTPATNSMKRALLPTPSHAHHRLPLHGAGSQPSWSVPLHPSVPPTTHSHIHGRAAHNAGAPMLFPPDQPLAGVPPTGYGGAGPNPGILASLTAATYTQNQV